MTQKIEKAAEANARLFHDVTMAATSMRHTLETLIANADAARFYAKSAGDKDASRRAAQAATLAEKTDELLRQIEELHEVQPPPTP